MSFSCKKQSMAEQVSDVMGLSSFGLQLNDICMQIFNPIEIPGFPFF